MPICIRCRDESRDGWQAIESKGFRALSARNPKAYYPSGETNPASCAYQSDHSYAAILTIKRNQKD